MHKLFLGFKIRKLPSNMNLFSIEDIRTIADFSPGNTSGTVPWVKARQRKLTLVRANLTKVTSPPNSNAGGSRLIFSVPLSYFLFIFYLPQCTLPDFPSDSSLASLPFSPCCHHNHNRWSPRAYLNFM